MDPQQLLKAGKLTEAISALSSQLRDNPADARGRTFLFELLCFAGEYDRAEKQLNVLEQESSKESMLGTLQYRAALHAEKTRVDMFDKKSYPKQVLNGHSSAPVSGKLNGREFESISDADSRFGEKLELFAGGDYMWISFHDIATLRMEAPKRLRDLLWAPAKLVTGPDFHSRDLGEILVPVISPGSFQHSSDEVRLGRVSEWCEDEVGDIAPFGQKTLLVDGDEFPFLEIRELEIYSQLTEATIDSAE